MDGYLTHSLQRHVLFLVWIAPAILNLAACGGSAAGGGTDTTTPATSRSSGSSSALTPPPAAPVPYATVRLAWNPNPGPDIAGYYVYHGIASANHPDKVWAGNATVFNYGVFSSGAHYFAITAIDIYGNESRKSSEIYVAVP